MSDEKKELLLFQIGPVQEFIAQAENVAELWAGSYLLAKLIYEGIKKVPDYNENLIFPNFQKENGKENKVENALNENQIPTIPNRFLAFVPEGSGKEIAENVKTAIIEWLTEQLKPIVKEEDKAKKQAEAFLQITWAVNEYNDSVDIDKVMGENYKAIGKKLALRRNVRDFAPWIENEKGKEKDFLSGKENVISNKRGAINNLKLKLIEDFQLKGMSYKIDYKGENGASDSYIAVIAMDGDKMGASLSNLKKPDEHRSFSKSLAEFATSVKDIVENCSYDSENAFFGKLIYAGGDDVLAIVPAKKAIKCAEKLAAHFKEKMSSYKWKDDDEQDKEITASAGIAIGHKKVPLQDLVHAAHDAETRAKSAYNRNALAINILKRSGERIEWGCKWKSKVLDLYDKLNDIHNADNKQNAGLAHKLDAYLKPLAFDKSINDVLSKKLNEIVKLEVERLCERTEFAKDVNKESLIAISKAAVDEVFEKNRSQDFITTFLCETFINRPREEQ